MSVAPYRKFVAALVGVAILLIYRHSGIDVAYLEPLMVEAILTFVIPAVVYAVRNAPQ